MILIVDDKQENVFSLRTVLEQHGFSTDTALSGEDALKKVLKNEYALIILDVQMPVMDGYEVAEAITGFNKTKDIPIIFLSAVNKDKKFITKGFESGALEYLTKPVDPEILILKVRNFYRLYEKTNALKEAEKALTANVKELHQTLEALPNMAFTADRSGKITSVNKQWLQYSNATNAFPEGHPQSAPLQEQWLQAIENGEPVETEVCIRRLDDEKFYHHLLKATPVVIDGVIARWVGTISSIHDQKMLNETLEKKVAERTKELLEINRELEISNHDLQQFASVASHDLKEPLRKIQVFANFIKDKGKPEGAIANYLEKVLLSSERMNTVITDLLSFARLSAPDIFRDADLNEIIDGILDDLELVIEEKQATIHVSKLPILEVVPALMRQLFQNIISNALKFSRADVPPQVDIRAELVNHPSIDSPAVANGNYCRLSISDNGIGFQEKYVAKIFHIFQRLHTRTDYEGTGIGLAIAKKIVDRHNGFIAATSQPGEGSTFYIIVPVKQDQLHKTLEERQYTAASL
ncbi:sensor histidine kinase [Aridibaculum aurantiacum]|uniref:sensor histidine kinase n=1 Tax=Aridibaculum aurantiacum TaxID=2810307 RepID=UPI001A96E758|nr:response regulator [Aridibaculum aurantiacum]